MREDRWRGEARGDRELNALKHLNNFGNHLNILRTSLRSFVAEISAVANGVFNFFFCGVFAYDRAGREPVEVPVFSCTQLQCFSSEGDLVANLRLPPVGV